MKNKVSAIPTGYRSITPYLTVNNAAQAMEFYKKAFGAIEEMRFEGPGGKIGHAELKIGDSKIMLSDEFPEMDIKGPQTQGSSPVAIHLYIEDVDSVVQKAVALGAKIIRPADDKFYGDRSATLQDPYGHTWNVATHIEDVSVDEVQKRASTQGKILLNLVIPKENR